MIAFSFYGKKHFSHFLVLKWKHYHFETDSVFILIKNGDSRCVASKWKCYHFFSKWKFMYFFLKWNCYLFSKWNVMKPKTVVMSARLQMKETFKHSPRKIIAAFERWIAIKNNFATLHLNGPRRHADTEQTAAQTEKKITKMIVIPY